MLASKVEYLCATVSFSLEELALCADMLYWEVLTWPEIVSQSSHYDIVASIRNVFIIEDLYREGGRFKYYDREALVGPKSDSSNP